MNQLLNKARQLQAAHANDPAAMFMAAQDAAVDAGVALHYDKVCMAFVFDDGSALLFAHKEDDNEQAN